MLAQISDQLLPTRKITSITRRAIFDVLLRVNDRWWGRLDEMEFLSRLWNLEALPSHDDRMTTAQQDIGTHRISFNDWPDDWILADSRFNLLEGDDQEFLGFLCETVNPFVRPDRGEVETLVRSFNRELAADGWALVVKEQISGRPVYGPVQTDVTGTVGAVFHLDDFTPLRDRSALEEHLRRIQAGLSSDPAGAIGASKELLESICKVILKSYGEDIASADKLTNLYKRAGAVLTIKTEAIPDSPEGSRAVQQVLGSLGSVVQGLAELRNEVGSGHGREVKSPAETRHARLAFDAASTVARFLLETWQVRQSD